MKKNAVFINETKTITINGEKFYRVTFKNHAFVQSKLHDVFFIECFFDNGMNRARTMPNYDTFLACDLKQVRFKKCYIGNGSFYNSTFHDSHFDKVEMKDPILAGATFRGCTFHEVQLVGIKGNHPKLMTMSQTRMTKSVIRGGNPVVSWEDCTFIDVTFRDVVIDGFIYGCHFIRCRFENVMMFVEFTDNIIHCPGMECNLPDFMSKRVRFRPDELYAMYALSLLS